MSSHLNLYRATIKDQEFRYKRDRERVALMEPYLAIISLGSSVIDLKLELLSNMKRPGYAIGALESRARKFFPKLTHNEVLDLIQDWEREQS